MMKTLKVNFLLVGLVLLISSIAFAQDKSADKTQALREKLRQVEAAPVEGKSAVIQNLHMRALLSSRKQLAAAIDDDLNALRIMQAAVGNADPDTRKEIDAQIQSLT